MVFRLTNLTSENSSLSGHAAAFLTINPDPNVRIRPDQQVRLAIETGLGLVLLEDDRVCGLSLVYEFEVGEDPAIYSELGTMRVTSNGLGFQELFASLHLVQIRVQDDEGGCPEVFAVVSPGTASQHILEKRVGMVARKPPIELASVRGGAGVPFSASKTVLWASDAAFVEAGRKLVSLYQGNGKFQTPKGGEVVQAELGWLSTEILRACSN